MYIVLVVLFSFHFGLVLTVGCPRRTCPECPVASYGRINIKTNKQSVAFSFNFCFVLFQAIISLGKKLKLFSWIIQISKKKKKNICHVRRDVTSSRQSTSQTWRKWEVRDLLLLNCLRWYLLQIHTQLANSRCLFTLRDVRCCSVIWREARRYPKNHLIVSAGVLIALRVAHCPFHCAVSTSATKMEFSIFSLPHIKPLLSATFVWNRQTEPVKRKAAYCVFLSCEGCTVSCPVFWLKMYPQQSVPLVLLV